MTEPFNVKALPKRCKIKHWWSNDPHRWKMFVAKHDKYARRARMCLKCGIMQIESDFSYYDHDIWYDATKEEFDARIQQLIDKDREGKKELKEKIRHRNQIEKDRLKNLARLRAYTQNDTEPFDGR